MSYKYPPYQGGGVPQEGVSLQGAVRLPLLGARVEAADRWQRGGGGAAHGEAGGGRGQISVHVGHVVIRHENVQYNIKSSLHILWIWIRVHGDILWTW